MSADPISVPGSHSCAYLLQTSGHASAGSDAFYIHPTSENRPDPAIWDRIVVPAPTDGTMAAEYDHAIDDGKLDHANDHMAEARNCTSSTTRALEWDCSPLLWDGIRDSGALGIVRIPDLALDLLPKEPPIGRPLNTTKTVD